MLHFISTLVANCGFSVSLNEDFSLSVLWFTESLCACTVQIGLYVRGLFCVYSKAFTKYIFPMKLFFFNGGVKWATICFPALGVLPVKTLFFFSMHVCLNEYICAHVCMYMQRLEESTRCAPKGLSNYV